MNDKQAVIANNLDNVFKKAKTEVIKKQPQVASSEEEAKQQKHTPVRRVCPTGYGRDGKVDQDAYYSVVEENDDLKRKMLKNNDEIKRLRAKFTKLETGLVLERRMAHRNKFDNTDIANYEMEVLEKMQLENNQLKSKNKKLEMVIQGLKKRHAVNTFSSTRALSNAKSTMDHQGLKNEHLKMIKMLRENLRSSENEVRRLTKILNEGGAGSSAYFTKDMKEKAMELNETQAKLEKLQMNYDTQLKISSSAKQNLDEYIDRANQEAKKSLELERKVQKLESELSNMPDYIRLNEDYKTQIRILEENIQELTESPFIKDAHQRGNVYRKLQQKELELSAANRRKTELEVENDKLTIKSQSDTDTIEKLTAERDKFKEDLMRLKIKIDEREQNTRRFSDKLNLMNDFSEIESKLLDTNKMLKNTESDWSKINFLEKKGNLSVEELLKENERLVVEKGTLGSELEKNKQLLTIQQQINEDQQTLFEEDRKIMKFKLDQAMNRCDELSKLVDKNRREEITRRYPMAAEMERQDDSITEFSKDEESELESTENALDIYIGEAQFEKGLSYQLGVNLDTSMTFLTCDFFLHETQTSNLASGDKPMFNLQISYNVNVDDEFLDYAKNEMIAVDLYILKNNEQVLFGQSKIALVQLIEAEEKGGKSRVVNGVAQVFYKEDKNLLLGHVHYKMRMRTPILESIKWMREREQLLKELSPVEEVNLNQKDAMTNKGKKAVSFSIMLSKAEGIKVAGPPRAVEPYVYYQFYRFGEIITKTSAGVNPVFEDVRKFDTVYDTQLHNYLHNSYLEFIVLDNGKPLQVEMETGTSQKVNLIDNPDLDDLIGYAAISLRELMISGIFNKPLDIKTRSGAKCGELFVTVVYEENTKEIGFENTLLAKNFVALLADVLNKKGLNIENSFEIFRKEDKDYISRLNFQNVAQFTLDFSSSQEDLENLTKAVFGESNRLTRHEFYKIFSIHLQPAPREEVSHPEVKPKQEFSMSTFSARIGEEKNRTEPIFAQPQPSDSQVFERQKSTKLTAPLRPTPLSDRPIRELVMDIQSYMKKYKKNSIAELYKMIDRDGNTSLSKKELGVGINSIGLDFSPSEIERMYEEMNKLTKGKGVGYSSFKRFYQYYTDGN